MNRMIRRLAATVLAASLVGTLAACSSENDDLAELYRDGGNQGFISGDGRVEEIPEAERGGSVAFTGTAVDGSTVTSEDYAGQVLVLNFWYAGCGPCRAEAPFLEEAFQDTRDAGADFLGVNIYDGPEQASAFEETYGITYPSILARGDVSLKQSFAAWTSLQAAPTTLVLDAQGRVAARFFGQLESASILRTIVNDTIAEAP
jgi:peroxiredoxin